MQIDKWSKNSLNRISKVFNIIILSNIPFEYYKLRKAALIMNNLNFPFLQIKEKKTGLFHYMPT